ncbi:MAG: hypothetical protein ACE5HL_02385 [Terriglobia bacterium]
MTSPDISEKRRVEISVLRAPHWVPIFVVAAAVISFVPFFVGFLLGLSVSSDIVFGVYALISGVAADVVLRRRFGRTLLVWQRPRIPFVAFWIALCSYVILFSPLE